LLSYSTCLLNTLLLIFYIFWTELLSGFLYSWADSYIKMALALCNHETLHLGGKVSCRLSAGLNSVISQMTVILTSSPMIITELSCTNSFPTMAWSCMLSICHHYYWYSLNFISRFFIEVV
jgi:hypothetical protein